MLAVSDEIMNNNSCETSGQIQVKEEPDCRDSEPQVNAEGVFEIKPMMNEENMDCQNDKTITNRILGLGTTIKTEPGVEFQRDQQSDFNHCPLHSESGTEHVVQQIADCSSENKLQPLFVIKPQPKSSEIPSVCELQESDIPVESCQTILYDPVLGPTTVEIDVLSNEPQMPEKQLEQQQIVQAKSPHEQKQVWPKYSSRRNVDSSRQQDNQKTKSSNAGFLTYNGYNVKPCSVKLKRLKLTPEMVDQLYIKHQKEKQGRYSKLKKQRKPRTLYECSSSEDENCDNSPSYGQNQARENSRVLTFSLPQDRRFPDIKFSKCSGLSLEMAGEPVSSNPQCPDTKDSGKDERSTCESKTNEGGDPNKLPNRDETSVILSKGSCIAMEIRESSKIVPAKSSTTVKELSYISSDTTTIPAVESKQSSEDDQSESEIHHDEDSKSADSNFIPEANSSNCSASDEDDDPGDLSLISESEVTDLIVRTDSRTTLSTRAPTPSDPVLHEFEDYLLD